MKKHLLSALLLLWVLAVAGIGLQRLLALGATLNGNGPLALASDGRGTLWLGTRDELFRVDAYERLEARWPVARLGLREINSLATGRNGVLWIYDSALRRPFRCTLERMQCTAFGPATLDLDNNVRMTENAAGELLLADNNRHRVLRLGADGELLNTGAAHRRAYPNQLSIHDNQLLLADTDNNRIITLPADADGTGDIVLTTRQRPYRFVRRGKEWWVIEAGVALENGVLRHYRNDKAEALSLSADDPYDIADNGQRLFVSSRTDWQLLSLDPTSGEARMVSDTQLQAAFGAQRLAVAAARQQRRQIPLYMIAFMLPALGGGLLLQRRIDQEKAATAQDVSRIVLPHPFSTASTTHNAVGHPCITPDSSAFEAKTMMQNHYLQRAGLLAIPLMLLSFGMVWWLLGSRITMVLPHMLLMIGLLLIIPLLIFLGRRHQQRLLDQALVCGPQKLVHVVAGKPRRATSYGYIWLGENVLVMDHQLHTLSQGHGLYRQRLWPMHDIQREIGMRLPPTHVFDTDLALAMALLRLRPLLALRVFGARFGVAIALGLFLLLKIAEVASHFGLFKLLKLANLF